VRGKEEIESFVFINRDFLDRREKKLRRCGLKRDYFLDWHCN
jgi:hypothetical protein